MKAVVRIVAVMAIAGSLFGWYLYTNSEAYAAKFRPLFEQVKPGDTREAVMGRLGKPTHSCTVKTMVPSDGGMVVMRAVAQDWVWRIGSMDYSVRYAVDVWPVPPGATVASTDARDSASYQCGEAFHE